MEYIRVTTPITKIEKDELNIISGALSLKDKCVDKVMKDISEVYMLPVTTILNNTSISEISNKGYSRIPVYMDKRERVVGVLHVKDLTLINPNDSIPLKLILDKKKRSLVFTYREEKLSTLLNFMKQGRSHLAIVKQSNDNASPSVGVVTLEDIIEEILQTQIADETDIQANRHREHKEMYPHVNRITPNQWQWLALMHYLTEEVTLFSSRIINRNVIKKLLSQKVFFLVKVDNQMQTPFFLFKKNQPCDYFILILEGKVEVEIGEEKLRFEAGAFTNFGLNGISLSTEMKSTLNHWIEQEHRAQNVSSKSFRIANIKNMASPKKHKQNSPIKEGDKSKSTNKTSQKQFKNMSIFPMEIESSLKRLAYCPDFSLKVVETTYYMKINRITYALAYCASHAIEQKCSNSFVLNLQTEMERQTDLCCSPFAS